jgi:hypothetical protein
LEISAFNIVDNQGLLQARLRIGSLRVVEGFLCALLGEAESESDCDESSHPAEFLMFHFSNLQTYLMLFLKKGDLRINH